MHSFLVALAYMAMVFAPCAAAHWGDVLFKPYFGLDFGFFAARRQRRFGVVNPMLVLLEQQRAADELAELTEAVFIRPTAFRKMVPVTLTEALAQASPKRAASLEKAASLVARRLTQLSQAHALANAAVATEDLAVRTPTAAELDALYAGRVIPANAHETAPLPVLAVLAGPPEPDPSTSLHLVTPATPAASQVSVAA